MAKKPKMPKAPKRVRINPIVRAPIMRKGGEHRKSRSAERQADKRDLRQLVNKVGAGNGSAD